MKKNHNLFYNKVYYIKEQKLKKKLFCFKSILFINKCVKREKEKNR